MTMSRKRRGGDTLQYELIEGWGQQVAGWSMGNAAGLAVDSEDSIYIYSRGETPVLVFNREGSLVTEWGKGIFTNPHGIYVDSQDNVYCTDNNDHTVRKFSREGKLLRTWGTKGEASDTGCQGLNYRTLKRSAGPFHGPASVWVTPGGEMFIADGYGNARIHRFGPDGQLLLSWGEPGTGPGQFKVPHGVAVSRSGRVYVADRENNRVQIFRSDGVYLQEWPLHRPTDVYIDSEQLVFVTEVGHQVAAHLAETILENSWSRLSIFDLDGNLLARWGEADGGLPGSFLAAHTVCVDSRGDIYVGQVGATVAAASKINLPEGYCDVQKFARVRS